MTNSRKKRRANPAMSSNIRGYGVARFVRLAERVDQLPARFPSLYGELSFRSGIEDGDALSPAWRALFVKYGDRFLLGSDTWVAERWPQVADIMAGYRKWLAQLPEDVARKIAWGNGARLFLGE
jgi:predicted TIM-barrel fold metal-dependent hydrolase